MSIKRKLNGRQVLSISIQQATINNLETFYQIERECFTIEAFSKRHIAYLLENPDAVCLVAKLEDVIAGFIIGLVDRHGEEVAGRVYTLDVAVRHRRKGVGLRLLDEVERIFAKRGVKICCLEARKDNVAALKLYRKHGYVKVQELEDYYSGAHGVRFKKKLGA